MDNGDLLSQKASRRPAHIVPARPRRSVQVRFADGRIFEGPVGAPLGDFIDVAYPGADPPIVAAVVDGELRELSYRVQRDVAAVPIDTLSTDGLRIYQRSMSFVLIVAVHELFPQARIVIDHSVTLGGFFCQVVGRQLFSDQEIRDLLRRMQEIVAADEVILKERIPTREAIALFASQGYEDKVRLLAYRDEETIPVYSLRGVRDYFYGYMLPSTGKLRGFDLERYPPGLILRFTKPHHRFPLQSHRDYPKLMGVFREYGEWLNILGIEDVGSLNQFIESGRIREAVLVSEALHEKQIADIADDIRQRRDQIRIVLIAGPSSSGKTTFSRRLAVQLMVNGLTPFALGLDDYFVDRELTPRDENGQYDFESLKALDVERFNRDLVTLMRGEPVVLPRFDFEQGKSLRGPRVQLPKDTILLVEGIHGLNPALVPDIPAERIYRVYVSALTQLNIDHHNRIPTTDTRLLRRIVRDARYRGYTAQETIARWGSVRQGEELNIFPFQENADWMFNSALVYELSVLKPFAEPLLLSVEQGTAESLEARRLLAFLRWFRPCDAELVPDNSILREFIGGSIFRELKIRGRGIREGA